MLFFATAPLPAFVRGPVDFKEFSRLAVVLFSVGVTPEHAPLDKSCPMLWVPIIFRELVFSVSHLSPSRHQMKQLQEVATEQPEWMKSK